MSLPEPKRSLTKTEMSELRRSYCELEAIAFLDDPNICKKPRKFPLSTIAHLYQLGNHLTVIPSGELSDLFFSGCVPSVMDKMKDFRKVYGGYALADCSYKDMSDLHRMLMCMNWTSDIWMSKSVNELRELFDSENPQIAYEIPILVQAIGGIKRNVRQYLAIPQNYVLDGTYKAKINNGSWLHFSATRPKSFLDIFNETPSYWITTFPSLQERQIFSYTPKELELRYRLSGSLYRVTMFGDAVINWAEWAVAVMLFILDASNEYRGEDGFTKLAKHRTVDFDEIVKKVCKEADPVAVNFMYRSLYINALNVDCQGINAFCEGRHPSDLGCSTVQLYVDTQVEPKNVPETKFVLLDAIRHYASRNFDDNILRTPIPIEQCRIEMIYDMVMTDNYYHPKSKI
jgi:hypothetical protein